MKVKTIITLLLATSLIGCQDENDIGKIPVRIGACIDSKDCQYSRSNAQGDEEVTRCLVEIVMDGVSQGVETMTGNETTGFSFNATLYEGKSYDLYFWADQGATYYDATSLTSVSLASSQKPTVAYHGKQTLRPSSTDNSITATLTHAVAKVSYLTTTALQSGKTVTMTLPRVYTTFNVDQGGASGSSSSRSYSVTLSEPIASNAVVFSEYAFVDNEVQNVELSYTYAPAVTVSNAPISTNVHTTLHGDITNQATVGVTASIAASWTEVDQGYNTEEEEDEEEDDENGIDMGGTVLWAPCNLGAENPEDFGNYYQWSKLEPVTTGNFTQINIDFNKLNTIDLILKPEYDPAAQTVPWRMPTKEEFEELSQSTITQEKVAYNGTSVVKFTNKSTNKSIIFPFAGYIYAYGYSTPNFATYWTINCDGTPKPIRASLTTTVEIIIENNVSLAIPIRPVRDKPQANE